MKRGKGKSEMKRGENDILSESSQWSDFVSLALTTFFISQPYIFILTLSSYCSTNMRDPDHSVKFKLDGIIGIKMIEKYTWILVL